MNSRRAWAVQAAMIAAIGASWVTPAVAEPDAATDRRPNILFIFTDDHARQAIGAYGSKINTTPQLDRLASEGMLFRNCFCTNSICAPSRAVVLTGKHSHVNGVITNREVFDGRQQTFPKLLRDAGYQTALIGKWHLKSNPTGFDHWEVLPGQGRYYNPVFWRPGEDGRETVAYTGYVTDIITDMSIEWLEKDWDKSKPFLLMSHHKAPHRNWKPGPEHLTMYDDGPIPEPPTLFDDYEGRTTAARHQTMEIGRHLNENDLKLIEPAHLNDQQRALWRAAYGPKNEAFHAANLEGTDLVRWKYQRYIKDYLRCIASVDDNVGRLLDYLDRTGLADNTIVVYSSDQGFYLGERGWYDKRWMYEESMAMPLIVRWPGVVEAGSENTDLVQNLDFAQTFLDAAGVPIPSDMQGRSVVPLLRGQRPDDWRRSAYYHYYEFPGWHDVRRHYGVRTDRYKLIHYYDIEEWEFFDLQRDPYELRSAYDSPLYADTIAQLKTELKRLRAHYGVDEFEEPPAPPDPRKVELELVLHYDAEQVRDGLATDISRQGHDGTLVNVQVDQGLEGKAFSLDGEGWIQIPRFPGSLDPTYRPFTVGAWCRPEAQDGVVVSHGGQAFGYSLFIRQGRPHFNVQAGRLPFLVAGPQAVTLGEWVHLAGTVDRDARLTLWVNGEPVAQLDDGFFVNNRPSGGFGVGADIADPAGPYRAPFAFSGLIEDVRIYWGVLDRPTLHAWASK